MFWRLAAIVASLYLIQGVLSDDVNPCRRQPFRGRCPSSNGATPMRSQFVLRYYLRGGECVSYPYGHCANDDNEPKLFRYKEECEDTCVKAVTAASPTTVKPKESDSLVVDSKEVVETDTQVPQSSGEITYATGGIDSTTGSSYQSPKTECQRQRDSRGQGLIKGGFIPECSANGEFKQLQCEQDKSECFCVNVEGIEIDNSRTKSGQEKPDCEKIISASGQRTNECVGGAEVGPCRSTIPRFFYDESTQSCQPFSYSGCGGNGNNYATQAACERRCVPTKEAGKCHKGKDPLRTSQGQLVNCAKTECPAGYKCNVIQHSSVCCPDDEKSVVGVLHSGIGAAACELPKERGPCDRYELRFYFNKELNECKYFFYGGCEGNDNNFARVEECEKTCGAKVSGDSAPPPQAPFENKQNQPISTTTTERATTRQTTTTTTTTEVPTTRTTPTTTTTTEASTTTTQPQQRPTQPTFHLPTEAEVEVRTFPSVTTPELPNDRCLHPRDDGSCGGQFVRWLWNNENRKCESFAYTGCGGNGNNFASMEECLSICHVEVAKPEPLPEVVNVCETTVDAGDCSGTFMRYAFEPSTNDCHQFAYTGCGGNGNNFATISDCRKKCVPQKGLEPTQLPATASTALNVTLQITPTRNICDHPIETGECLGLFHRFGYDGESNECRQFEYGGCGGNGNNFATITECRLACVRTRCAPAPACDTSRCQIVNDVRGCPFCSCPPPPQHPPIIPNFQPEPSCPPLDINLCVEPCIIFSNRRGCKECVCPVLQNQLPPQSLPPSRPQQPVQAPVPAPDVSMPQKSSPPPLPRPTEAPRTTTTEEPIREFVPQQPIARPPAPQQPFVRPPAPQEPQRPSSPPRFEPERVSQQTPPPQRFTPRPVAPPSPPGPIRSPSPPSPPAPRINTNDIVQPIIEGVVTNERNSLPLPPQRPRATIADLGEKCTQPVDPGPCKNFVERWHFNEQQGECEPFSYGGCAGNRNHFFSRRECEIHCARFSRVPRPIVEIDEVIVETPRPVVTFPSTTTPSPTVQTRQPLRPHTLPQTPPPAPTVVPTQPSTTLPPTTATTSVHTQPPRRQTSPTTTTPVTSTVSISFSNTPLIKSTKQPFVVPNFIQNNNQNWQAPQDTFAQPLHHQQTQQHFIPQQNQQPPAQHLPTSFVAPLLPRQQFNPQSQPTNPPQAPWIPTQTQMVSKIEPPRFNTNPQTADGATSRSSTVVWKPEVVSTFAPYTQPRFETTFVSTTLPPTTTRVIPSSTTALRKEHPTNPPPLTQQNFQEQWHQTSPPHFIQTNPPFVRQLNTGFTQQPPPQRPTFVETTILPPHAPPASPPLFHPNSQQNTFLLQNNNAAIPAQPQPQRPVERIVPLQPIAQQPHFRIPTLPPKLPLPDANRQFAQPTFNQAAFEKALPPSPEVVKSEYQPPNPPIRTDFNPYIPPPPQTREGYSPPVQPTVHRPVNPQDQWPANTRKPAGGSYGMEEISPTRESNHINIQPIKPAPEVPHVQHQWPVTTPQPSTTLHAVEESKPENLVPIFAASSHPPQQIPTSTPTLTRLPIKHIAPVAPPRIIQPSQQENEYSNGQETVETPVASQKPPQANAETVRTVEKPKIEKPLAPAAPSHIPANIPDQYSGETVKSVVPSNKQPSRINEQINHEYASGPEKSKPSAPIESQPQPNSKPINHEYSTGPETEKHPPVSPVEKSKPAPEIKIITAPKAPSFSSPTTVAATAPQGSNSGGYEEPTTKFPTLKPEVSTSDTPTNSVEAQKPATTNYETSETPEESLVVLDKISAEAEPKADETSSTKAQETEVKETSAQPLPETYEISDITASSTSAPVEQGYNKVEVKPTPKSEVKPTANVNEYRVFGEKSNTQNAIEPPPKIPETRLPKLEEERNNLGKILPSIESKNTRLQVIDGGSDRSVGRKPIALPEGLVNIPINKEMENILIEEGIVSQQSGNGGKGKTEGEMIVNGRGEGMTSGFVESGNAKNVKVEFSTSEPVQTENIVQVVEVVKQANNVNTVQPPKITEFDKGFETKTGAKAFTRPTPPRAPLTLSTPPSRLTFAEKQENIEISNLPVNPTIPSSTNLSSVTTTIHMETTAEEFVTVPTTRKLIRIQPIHPTTVDTETEEITSQPTTSEPITPAEKKDEKILAPIITVDVEEHHPHGMLEEVINAKPEETVEKPKLIAAETVENQSVKPILEQTNQKFSPEASITASTTASVQNTEPHDVKITVPVQISEPHQTNQASGAPVKIVKESIEIVQVPNVNIDASNKPAENSQTYQHSSNIFQSTHGVKTSQQGEIHISEPEIQRVPTRPIFVPPVQSQGTPSPTIIYQSFNKTVKFNEDKAEESHTEYKRVQTSSHSTSNQQQINTEREEITEIVTNEKTPQKEVAPQTATFEKANTSSPILYSPIAQQERVQTESTPLSTSIHLQENAQTDVPTPLSSTTRQENAQPSTLSPSTLSQGEVQTQPFTQTRSTLSQIVSSPQTITFSPPSSSNPPSEPVEENNINEAFTVEPRKATRPPPPPATRPTQVPTDETSEEMVPQPAPVFTPRPIFRPNPTTFTPPPSNTVEHVTIFGPPEKPEFDSEACVMPPDSGKCSNFVPRWFYNAEKGSCQEFSYGSCGGNANNFVDKVTCESRCATPSVNAVLPQRCNWPKDEGFGIGYHPKWYFNGRNLRCEQMVFRGSGGNDNQFSSQSDCDLSCKPVKGSFVPQVPQPPPRKGHKETDKKQPLPTNFVHGTLTAVEGYDGAGVPSPVQEIPDKAPAEVPYAPTANAPAGKQPTSPASGPAPATAPHAPSVDVNQYVPAPPPLRVDYNNVEENASAPAASSAPAPAPISHSTAPTQSPAPSSHSSSNSNVEGNQGEGYNGQGSAPSAPVAPTSHVAPEVLPSAPETHNHEAGIHVGRGEYEEPTVPGINHEANINVHQNNGINNGAHSNTVDMESVDETMSNTNQGHIEQIHSSNNVEQSHGSASSSNVEESQGSATGAHIEQTHESQTGSNVQSHGSATSSNTQGDKYESNNENVQGGTESDDGGAVAPAAPAPIEVVGSSTKDGYNAIPAETQMVDTPDSHLPMLGKSPKMEIDYVKGKRLDVKAEGIRTAHGEFITDNLTDKDLDSVKPFNGVEEGGDDTEDDKEAEENARIPVCPNGLQAKLYDNGRPVMCLPGKDQCPENSVCYFNGMDYFCCPNTDDPYDQHIFGGYDGEEVKHGYKSVPSSLNIRAIRRKRQAGLPPSSFSIDHITKPLRFDDKPVKQISRAGSVDALARLRVNPCTQDVQEGDCNDAHLRYFYDIKTDTCRLFYYSGCNGNANNFITQNECNQRCKLGIVITTTEAPVPPGRCPGGKSPLGDNAPVLCGNQTDSIGCPRGYYCRNGPPDVCCPDDIPDLQTILSQNVNREIRRRPFINAAGKFEGGHHHHHEHEHHYAVHGVATEHAAPGYDGENAAVNIDKASQTHVHEHTEEVPVEQHVDAEHSEHTSEAGQLAPEAPASSPIEAEASAPSTSAPQTTTFGLPDNICPDGSDALMEKDGKSTKMCGSGFDGHELCPKGFYCSIDPERNSRLCCPMTLQGSNIPQPPVIAPYFGHRRHNPGEVVERGSLPSDPKPPKLATPKPKVRMTMEDFENMGVETNAEFHAPGASEGVQKGNYDENDAMPGARPETHGTAETDSQLDSKPDKVAIEENPAEPNSVAPAQVQPADMPTEEGQEKGPYAHLRLKPFIRQNKLQRLQSNSSTSPEDEHVQIRTSSQEDPFEIDGENKKVYKEVFDLSMCQLRPSEGRQCREDEPQPLTNLQYFYSMKDKKCKLFFHRGCGGNSNRFNTKADCEKACSSLMGQ